MTISTQTSLSPVNHVLAFDLGTGESVVAGVKDGRPFTLKGPDGTTIPTVVFRQENGATVVGKAALRMAYRDVANVFANFKPAMKEDGVAILSADGKFSVVDAIAAVLKHLLGVARQAMPYLGNFPQFGGEKFDSCELRIAITIPAVDFGLQQIAKYKTALVQAGFPEAYIDEVVFFKEPYAAAHEALAERNLRGAVMENDVIATVDGGDGTFDLTIAEVREGLLHTKTGHSGISDLGGSNFTAALAVLIGKQLGVEFLAFERGRGVAFDADDVKPEDRETQYGIWSAATDCKHQLSLADTAIATVMTGTGNREVSLTIDDAKASWKPLFDEVQQAIEQALGKSGLRWPDVRFVVAAGGAIRTRGMGQLIADATQRSIGEVLVCDEPQLAIVEGAVRMGQSLEEVDTSAVDAMGLSYPDSTGKQIVNEVYIENGQTIPAGGLDVEKLTTRVRSNGQQQTLQLYPFLSKPSVLANSGDLLSDAEIVRLNPVEVPLTLPQGEHPVAVRMRFDVAQRSMCVLSFPTLPQMESQVVCLQIAEVSEGPALANRQVDIVILFDSSTSMLGDPLEDAIEASGKMISDVIDRGSMVAVVDFGDAPEVIVDYTDDASAAVDEVERIVGKGSTPMASALQLATKMSRAGRETIVVLFTDGYPNDESATIKAAKALRAVAELYTVAIGEQADSKLISQLASSPAHFFPIGRAGDLSIAFEAISTLIYTGEQPQVGAVIGDTNGREEGGDELRQAS